MRRSTLILIINLSVLLLVVLIGLAVQVAPCFTASLLALSIVTFLFLLTEQSMTHAAVEFENRFWTLMAFGLASACLFSSDSPAHLGHKPEIAWVIVFIFTFFAHNYDRHLQRVVLKKATNIRRVRSQDFCPVNRTNAQEKVVELRKLLSTIDHVLFSSTLQNIFFLYRVLQVEGKIIQLISEANSDELNLILNNIELALLFYKMKDHKFARCFNRSNLLKLLAVDRIGELVIPTRVVLLDSLQRLKLSAHPQCEYYVQNIIFNTKADDLSELKTLMDSKGDVNSMHKLVYNDIRNPAVKESILKYIAHQADIQKAHSKIGSRKGKLRGLLAWRKILSDVDDTLTCSGGSWPAGMDTSYPKKAVYPGVLSFYRELDMGTVGADEWDKATRAGNLAFLSARPHVYKSVSENVSYLKFRTLQDERGFYTSPTLLAGSLDTGGQFMVKGDSEPLALKKFENFREYLALYPEYTCIFIGDNGQGDVRTAELVLGDKVFAENLHRVYVHQVQPRHLTYCRDVGTLKSPRVHFFGTYVDAAIDAYRHKLIRARGLRNVMDEACADFLLIPDSAWLPAQSSKAKPPAPGTAAAGGGTPNRGRSPSLGGVEVVESAAGSPGAASGAGTPLPPAASDAQVAALAAAAPGPFPLTGTGVSKTGSESSRISLSRLREAIAAAPSPATPSRDTSRPQLSAAGSAGSLGGRESPSIPMLTRRLLGRSAASKFNIKRLKTGAIPGEGLTAASMGYCRGGAIVRTFTSAAAEASVAERKRELRLREINNDLERGNELLREARLPPVDYLAFACRYGVGTTVNTMFGEGIITGFRSEDGIYEVLVGWEDVSLLESSRYAGSDAGKGAEKGAVSGPPGGTQVVAEDAVVQDATTGGVTAMALSLDEGIEASTGTGLTTVPEEPQELKQEKEEGQGEGIGMGMGQAGPLLRRESSGDLNGAAAGRLRGGIKMYIAGVAIHSQ